MLWYFLSRLKIIFKSVLYLTDLTLDDLTSMIQMRRLNKHLLKRNQLNTCALKFFKIKTSICFEFQKPIRVLNEVNSSDR
jgi:hypothetical protein